MIKPGELVLVPDYENDCHRHWKLDIYSHKLNDNYYTISGSGSYGSIIPYKGNEELLGQRVMDTGQLKAGI